MDALSPRSIPPLEAHDGEHPVAGGIAAQVLSSDDPALDTGQVRSAGDVRTHDDPRRSPQWVIGRKRLGLDDVEPGSAEAVRIERLSERTRDDARPARHVDED